MTELNRYDKQIIEKMGTILEACKEKIYEIFKKELEKQDFSEADLTSVINGFAIQVFRERYYMLHQKKKE